MSSISLDFDPMPQTIIIGLWQLADSFPHQDLKKVHAVLRAYIEAGFTTFDTADIYGPAEKLLGLLQRTEKRPLRILTKFIPQKDMSCPARSHFVRYIDSKRRTLHQDVIDLMQFHSWTADPAFFLPFLDELFELKSRGFIREIGLCNFSMPMLQKTLAHGLAPYSQQIAASLVESSSAAGTIALGRTQGLRSIGYGVMMGGLFKRRAVLTPSERRILAALPRNLNLPALLDTIIETAVGLGLPPEVLAARLTWDVLQLDHIIIGSSFQSCRADDFLRILELKPCPVLQKLMDLGRPLQNGLKEHQSKH